MVAVPTNFGSPRKDDDFKDVNTIRSRPLHNVGLELLSDSDSVASECEIKAEEEILEEYKKNIALSKKEAECRTLSELKELQEM